MKSLKLLLPAGILAAGFMVCTTASYGTPAIAKKEGGKSCVTCHVKMGSKDLNDTGKCYKTNKSLAKCPAPAEKK
jgi:hypothetical protein